MEKEGRESWRFYKFDILGLKWVPEKDFEALRGAELMKMRCRSVWDTSRGLKPSKICKLDLFLQVNFGKGMSSIRQIYIFSNNSFESLLIDPLLSITASSTSATTRTSPSRTTSCLRFSLTGVLLRTCVCISKLSSNLAEL